MILLSLDFASFGSTLSLHSFPGSFLLIFCFASMGAFLLLHSPARVDFSLLTCGFSRVDLTYSLPVLDSTSAVSFVFPRSSNQPEVSTFVPSLAQLGSLPLMQHIGCLDLIPSACRLTRLELALAVPDGVSPDFSVPLRSSA